MSFRGIRSAEKVVGRSAAESQTWGRRLVVKRTHPIQMCSVMCSTQRDSPATGRVVALKLEPLSCDDTTEDLLGNSKAVD